MWTQAASWHELEQSKEVDVLIIGAGINGCAVFNKLSRLGYHCILIDNKDFSSGASGACSRMVHGGLRYLEHGDIKLVKQALSARNDLLQDYPNLVKPINTIVPCRSLLSGLIYSPLKVLGLKHPNYSRGALLIYLGLFFYKLLSLKSDSNLIKKPEFKTNQQLKSRLPQLNSEFNFAGIYTDAFIASPERMAIEQIKLGLAASNSKNNLALNYVQICQRNNKEFELKNLLTNQTHSITTTTLINATGAWCDQTNLSLGSQSKFISGTKGSHIIVRAPQIYQALQQEMIYFETSDKRVCIIIPWYKNLLLVGTTDLKISSPDKAQITEDEIDYLLAEFNYLFPTNMISKADLVCCFTGVRPLAASQSTDTASMTREFKVTTKVDKGVTTINMFGGKWTTFQAHSDLAISEALAALNKKPTQVSSPAKVTNQVNKNAVIESTSQLSPEYLNLLSSRYSIDYQKIVAFITNSTISKQSKFIADYSIAEIEYLINFEAVACLEDLVLRRTRIALNGLLTKHILAELTQVLAECLAWTPAQAENALEKCELILSSKYRINLS
ncbi:glycerol-3-phosphate dehydrogenase/oxidase [Catenovulum maritimum]|uniref:FAD dependent oxidoreductase domain-containing protein n=1 Tax=Catenovulum maritimum TaxID=1513271 RepID=A0A0J8GRK1_9ALTE|nr:glycerol-3-phosphate dehydrogenase/oxidase [Catenovulum maritimum]KMT65337.1 hypothetical protein XM47_09920 [Catenovulum maritimum]